MTLVWIGMAGAAGAVARLLVADWAGRWRGGSAFPWGTFVVNIIGALLLGLLTGLLGRGAISPGVKAVLGTGFLGAFTTFSTWQNEVFLAHRRGHRRAACLSLIVSTASGMAAAWLGLLLGGSL